MNQNQEFEIGFWFARAARTPAIEDHPHPLLLFNQPGAAQWKSQRLLASGVKLAASKAMRPPSLSAAKRPVAPIALDHARTGAFDGRNANGQLGIRHVENLNAAKKRPRHTRAHPPA